MTRKNLAAPAPYRIPTLAVSECEFHSTFKGFSLVCVIPSLWRLYDPDANAGYDFSRPALFAIRAESPDQVFDALVTMATVNATYIITSLVLGFDEKSISFLE